VDVFEHLYCGLSLASGDLFRDFLNETSVDFLVGLLPGSACADGDEGCGEQGRAAIVTDTAQISTETTTVSNGFRCMNPPLVNGIGDQLHGSLSATRFEVRQVVMRLPGDTTFNTRCGV
jgi:hypothetical protein